MARITINAETVRQAEYTADLPCATWDVENEAFFIWKKLEYLEINIDLFPKHAKDKFTNPKTGSRQQNGKVLVAEARFAEDPTHALAEKVPKTLSDPRGIWKMRGFGSWRYLF